MEVITHTSLPSYLRSVRPSFYVSLKTGEFFLQILPTTLFRLVNELNLLFSYVYDVSRSRCDTVEVKCGCSVAPWWAINVQPQ